MPTTDTRTPTIPVSAAHSTAVQLSRWRSLYPVHPCADVFPMMSDADLDALGHDILIRGG
jgi:hypothetical protein